MRANATSTDVAESRSSGDYLHEFHEGNPLFGEAGDHERLAGLLRGFSHARVVVSYYDCERVRRLYDGWRFIDCRRNKNLHAQNGRGPRQSEAPEVLIVNR